MMLHYLHLDLFNVIVSGEEYLVEANGVMGFLEEEDVEEYLVGEVNVQECFNMISKGFLLFIHYYYKQEIIKFFIIITRFSGHYFRVPK